MNTRSTTRAASNHAAVYLLLILVFGAGWLAHRAAVQKMGIAGRQFAVMNDSTRRATALVDWVAANPGSVVAYVIVAVASIAFLQIRRRPRWTCWVTALAYCIPAIVYWLPCAYIAGKVV